MQTLLDIVHRTTDGPVPEKVPWDDRDFSRRMLREHLTQAHDAASRRTETLEAHVQWIDQTLLTPGSRVLDLGCGPGLYTTRLARLGHSCIGIDFSPASIEYATDISEGLDAVHQRGDIRTAEYGGPYDLVMILFGEIHAFSRDDARTILQKSCDALTDGGRLLVERHALEALHRAGTSPPTWYAAPLGIFSDEPHIVLEEHAWSEDARSASTAFFVVDAESAEVSPYGERLHAYEDAELLAILGEIGFRDARIDNTFPASTSDLQHDFAAVVATK